MELKNCFVDIRGNFLIPENISFLLSDSSEFQISIIAILIFQFYPNRKSWKSGCLEFAQNAIREKLINEMVSYEYGTSPVCLSSKVSNDRTRMEMHTCLWQPCHVIVTCRTNVFLLKGLCVYSQYGVHPGCPRQEKFASIYERAPCFHSIPLHDPFSMKLCRISSSALSVTYFLFHLHRSSTFFLSFPFFFYFFIKSTSLMCFHQPR